MSPTLAAEMLLLLLLILRWAVNGDDDGVLFAAPRPPECIDHLCNGGRKGDVGGPDGKEWQFKCWQECGTTFFVPAAGSSPKP